MSAVTTTREVGFAWFDRHAVYGTREIFQWTHSKGGRPASTYPQPFIAGARWESRDAMRAFYAAGGDVVAEEFPGFLGYVPGDFGSFPSWEEAEAWLLGDARRVQ